MFNICNMQEGQKGWASEQHKTSVFFSKIVMIANMPDESSTATVGTLICKITEGKGG